MRPHMHLVAEASEEVHQLIESAIDLTDDVEGAPLPAPIDREWHPVNGRRLGGLKGIEHVDGIKALLTQAGQGTQYRLSLGTDNPRPDRTPGTGSIALHANLLGKIEDDGGGRAVVLSGEGEKRSPIDGARVDCVDHGQAPAL